MVKVDFGHENGCLGARSGMEVTNGHGFDDFRARFYF